MKLLEIETERESEVTKETEIGIVDEIVEETILDGEEVQIIENIVLLRVLRLLGIDRR